MIEKIRRKLIWKYTVLLTFILLLCFGGSYTAYRYSIIKFLHDDLEDYLTEEVWEAKEHLSKPDGKITRNRINADINSLHNFAYWFLDGRLVHAEEPRNTAIAEELAARLHAKEFAEKRIHHENIKRDKQKWYFIILKQSFLLDDGRKGNVFVLANYTPVRKNTKAYVKIAVIALGGLSLLAFFISGWLASRSMEHIEVMYQKQKQFVSDAAHELRTPLSILLSYVELLEYKPKDTKLAGTIKEQILQMNELLDNLLTIARYDNNAVPLNPSRFDLSVLAADAVKAFSHLCPNGIKLNKPKAPVFVTADEGMIRQLLYILLDNAVKYTGADKKIVVGIEQGRDGIKLSVADNGIGISGTDMEQIFERFWRADKSRNTQGLGLGLNLAHLIVSLHKGKISVASEPEKGSVFEVGFFG